MKIRQQQLMKIFTSCKACQKFSSSMDWVLQLLLRPLQDRQQSILIKNIPENIIRQTKIAKFSLPSCTLSKTRGTPARKVGFNSIKSSRISLISLMMHKQQNQLLVNNCWTVQVSELHLTIWFQKSLQQLDVKGT